MASFYTDSEAESLGLYGPDQSAAYKNPQYNDFTSNGSLTFSSAGFTPNSTTPGGVTTNSQGIPTVGIGGSTPTTPATGAGSANPTDTGSTNTTIGSITNGLVGGTGTSSLFSTAYWNDILIRGGLILLAVALIAAGIYLLGREVVTGPADAGASIGRKALKGFAI